MTLLVVGALALVVVGPIGVGLVLVVWVAQKVHSRRKPPFQLRPLLVVLLIELRSGMSVLGALQAVAARFPEAGPIGRAARVAAVVGLTAAAEAERGELRVLLTHLARSQAAGTSAADAVRRMIESDLARQRSLRLARARALPIRLMLPVSLLILPGVILISYGPMVVSLLDGLAVPLG